MERIAVPSAFNPAVPLLDLDGARRLPAVVLKRNRPIPANRQSDRIGLVNALGGADVPNSSASDGGVAIRQFVAGAGADAPSTPRRKITSFDR